MSQVNKVRPAPSVHARTFDGEVVLLDLAGGEYYALDAIGAQLWDGLGTGQSVEDVAAWVADAYDVAFERALADLVALADELVRRGLLLRETK